MIYLNPQIVSGLGEDTFWTWFQREFPSAVLAEPKYLKETDCILRYSTLGDLNISGKKIGLLWELYPEMKRVFKTSEYDPIIKVTNECARMATYRVVTSKFMIPFYERFGSIDVLPIGVNTNLFRPMSNKQALRKKWRIPTNKKIGFWCGTTHPMKGFKQLTAYAKKHLKIHWIIVWKQQDQAGDFPGQSNFVHINQIDMAELMNASDFMLVCGLLEPFL